MNKEFIRKLTFYRNKLINRETIVYLIAGVLTTLLNLAVYGLLCNVFEIYYLISNIIAWVAAVIFAYIINDLWVFRSPVHSIGKELFKLFKFLAARGFSLLIEEAGLYLFVNLLKFNNMAVKISLAVIVIILNYLFSKIYVFNKKKI